MKIRNVLSLFNGMSTLQQAMANSNIEYENYYSSEIKKYAIKLNQHHFPYTIQLGDIQEWEKWDIDWSKIDFIGSGSPCQDLSIAGNRAGLNGSNSSLFFTFIDILNHVRKLNPNVIFLQENVGSANKTDIGIMSRAMGVYPVRINSSLVTAHLRDRYYWTNIKTRETMFDLEVDIPQPKDKNIVLCDIIESGFTDKDKHNTLMQRTYNSFMYKDMKGEKAQAYMIRREKKSFTTLIHEDGFVRIANKTELCRLQGFPDDYCDILTLKQSGSLLGDGWTLPIIEHILSFYKL